MERLIYIITICIGISLYSQKNTFEIDSLLYYKNENLIHNGKLSEAIALNNVLLTQSEKQGYTKGIVWAHINLSRVFSGLGNHRESIRHLHIVKQYDINDEYLIGLKYFVYGRNLGVLDIARKSNESYDIAIKYGLQIKDIDRKQKFLGMVYGNKAYNFIGRENEKDSLEFYMRKAYHVYPNPNSAADLCDYFLRYRVNIDSATIYLEKADTLFKSGAESNSDNKWWILVNYKNVYFMKKDYERSLEYCRQALMIALRDNRKFDIKNGYQSMAEIYTKLNNKEKANEYFQKYAALNDRVGNQARLNTNISVNEILKEYEEESIKSKNKFYWIVLALILSGSGIIFTVYHFYRKTKVHLTWENQQHLEKKKENNELKQKINVVSTNISELAKKNDPTFLIKFQSLYPDFCNKLLQVNSTISKADMVLCAMIKLGFTSKDIAHFTYVQLNTVHVKKYRLKKKLNIPEEVSLSHYLKNI